MYVCSGEVRCGCLLRPATALGLAWPVTVLAVLSPRHSLQKAGESASVRGWLSVVSEVCPRGNAVLLPVILCALHGFCLYVMYVCFLSFLNMNVSVCSATGRPSCIWTGMRTCGPTPGANLTFPLSSFHTTMYVWRTQCHAREVFRFIQSAT